MAKEELNQSKETYIYRIMPLKYFLTMIESRKLYLPCMGVRMKNTVVNGGEVVN